VCYTKWKGEEKRGRGMWEAAAAARRGLVRRVDVAALVDRPSTAEVAHPKDGTFYTRHEVLLPFPAEEMPSSQRWEEGCWTERSFFSSSSFPVFDGVA